MRFLALLLALAGLALAAEAPAFVEAVEFPYYLFPQPLWERELVWLKNIGVDTVVFPSRGTGIRSRAGNWISPAAPVRGGI